jgi:hypothetical protein
MPPENRPPKQMDLSKVAAPPASCGNLKRSTSFPAFMPFYPTALIDRPLPGETVGVSE